MLFPTKLYILILNLFIGISYFL